MRTTGGSLWISPSTNAIAPSIFLLTVHPGPHGLRIDTRTFEAQNAEMTPTGGEIRIRHFLNTFQRHS